MLGIIGGTGLAQLANLEITHRQVIRTPYGEPSGALTFGNLGDTKSEVRKILATTFTIRRKPELGTQPNVYYIV